jgi:hypothetical protein
MIAATVWEGMCVKALSTNLVGLSNICSSVNAPVLADPRARWQMLCRIATDERGKDQMKKMNQLAWLRNSSKATADGDGTELAPGETKNG